MPHNVYTGDEGGRVVRTSLLPSFFSSSSSAFFSSRHGGKEDGRGKKWCSRKAGFEGRIEKRGGLETGAVWGAVGQGRAFSDWESD
jgi:hypothetical protein